MKPHPSGIVSFSVLLQRPQHLLFLPLYQLYHSPPFAKIAPPPAHILSAATNNTALFDSLKTNSSRPLPPGVFLLSLSLYMTSASWVVATALNEIAPVYCHTQTQILNKEQHQLAKRANAAVIHWQQPYRKRRESNLNWPHGFKKTFWGN